MPEEYWTVDELVQSLRVTKQTVCNWIKKGKIKAIKIDRTIRIPKSQFALEGKEDEKIDKIKKN